MDKCANGGGEGREGFCWKIGDEKKSVGVLEMASNALPIEHYILLGRYLQKIGKGGMLFKIIGF